MGRGRDRGRPARTALLRRVRPGEETLPGGRFARIRLHGEPPAVYEQIGPAFRELHDRYDVDGSRLQLEHYRRRDEIDVLLPIR